MSQQLQITGGAKVRSLEGVITGSTGVLGSLPINGANGIPQLDSNGKILVSQLPNSVMEYKGTWNVTTNTPYLVNGTGNAGDVYLVEGAATGGTSHDFGAGAITFYNGDQVIYSGSIWQRGAGSSGTVTSVAITESGDALTITGSPITNSGTINIGFAGTSAQYVAGNGTLVTFPTITTEAQRLITEVYNETGATLTKGTVVYINGGHGNLPTIAKALATSDATSAQTYGVVQTDITNNNNGFVVVIGSLTDLDTQAYANGTQLYLSSTTAGAWTSTKQYAPAHLVYVGIVTRSHPTQGVVEIKIQNGYELDELHNVSAQTPSNNDGLFYNSSNSLWENKSIATALGYTPVPNTRTLTINGVTYDLTANRTWTISTGISGSGTTNYLPKWTGSTALGNSLIYDNGTNVGIGTASPTSKLSVAGTTAISGQLTLGDTITNGTYTYTLPSATGTLALTSDIPSVTNFVTLNTLQTIIGTKIYSSLQYFDNNVYIKHSISGSSAGYTTLGASASGLNINLASGTSNNSLLFASTSASNTYTFPNATGTIALTTDLSSYVPTSRTLTINGTTYDLSANRSWTISGTSQWTTSGSDIYYNTGNVGIGSSSPITKTDFRLDAADGVNGSVANSYPISSFIVNGGGGGTRGLQLGGPTSGVSSPVFLKVYGTSQRFSIIDSSNVENFTINGGNVGISTTTPSYLLTVGQAGTTANSYIQIASTTTGTGNVFFGDTTGTGSGSYSGYLQYQHSVDAMIFGTSANERMRITSTGNVLIGTSTDGIGKLQVNGQVRTSSAGLRFPDSYGITTWEYGSDTSVGTGVYMYYGGTGYVFTLTAAGVLSTTGGGTSDKRTKENIKYIDTNVLELIKELKPVSFNFIKDTSKKTRRGFIAQDVLETNISDLVLGDGEKENGTYGLDYDGILALAVKAIQELKAEIDELKNK